MYWPPLVWRQWTAKVFLPFFRRPVSFTGTITFPRSGALEVATAIPLTSVMVETDCPYLSPDPGRRNRNEPANIPVVAQALADCLDMEVGEIERITDASATELFARSLISQTG